MKQKPCVPSETDTLKQELRDAQDALFFAYQRFDLADAPELVEASIYEIKASRARFDYLYRCIREKQGAAAAAEEEKAWV